ncbi:MAG: precorrin-6A reductase [Clostridia bacterium]|nr:precorrin-6A reductase [Clostridia bacterium]
MSDILIIAGTADARHLLKELSKLNIPTTATVATKFGSDLLGESPDIKILEGRLDSQAMEALIKQLGIKCLIDASHPYAKEVSLNAIKACEATQTPYIRYERRETINQSDNLIITKDFEEAAKQAAQITGNIFLAIGSNHLEAFTNKIPDFTDRLFARVLPDSKVISKCEAAGLTAKNIIALKGPFSEALNIEMLKHCNAKVIVTKDSGKEGGTDEKLSAAEKLGIPVIVVGRPTVVYGTVVNEIDEAINLVKKILHI